ncbi:hypothetical protein OIU77_025952 [Salix suchowensis]|uniref:Carbohydrate kinase PfkB domain-containing protein n=1 Tax=Salix suchowensis TaxID=1278906 RepID=A0ABQ9BY23_9ROSI|nr:hypothetical protein OIU77_025952 [Salix suchowensis]
MTWENNCIGGPFVYIGCSLVLEVISFACRNTGKLAVTANMAIAAARLGLDCATIGHVGDEIYAQFLLDVLHEEGMSMAGMHVCEDDDIVDSSFASYETLLCWVLADP